MLGGAQLIIVPSDMVAHKYSGLAGYHIVVLAGGLYVPIDHCNCYIMMIFLSVLNHRGAKDYSPYTRCSQLVDVFFKDVGNIRWIE